MLYVLIRYYGDIYCGYVAHLTNKAARVRFTLGDGRTVERRVSIVPTPSEQLRGREPLRLTTPSADKVTARRSAFGSFAELLDAPNYRPTLKGDGEEALLANTYDAAMMRRNDPRRAYRRSRA